MSNRPTRDPRWAHTSPPDYSEPSESLRATGFEAGDPALASEVNAVLNNLGDVARWVLDGVRQPPTMSSFGTLTINAAAKTVTRTTGSWLDDGFHDGMMISFTNWVNAGNNTTQVIDGEPSDTVLTLTSSSGLVNEADTSVTCVAHYYVRQRLTVSQPTTLQQTLDVTGDVTSGSDITGSRLFADTSAEIGSTLEVGDVATFHSDAVFEGSICRAEVLSLSALAGTFHANFAGDDDGVLTSSGSATTRVGIPLPRGAVITDVEVRIAGNSTVQISAQLKVSDGAGASTSLSGAADTAVPSATWQDLDLGAITSHPIAANESVYLVLATNGAAGKIAGIDVSWNIPAP